MTKADEDKLATAIHKAVQDKPDRTVDQIAEAVDADYADVHRVLENYAIQDGKPVRVADGGGGGWAE